MQTKKYYPVLAATIGILCVVALAQTESPQFDLIASSNPTLVGIRQLDVIITTRGTDPNRIGLDSKILKAEVERQLEKAGIKVFVPKKDVTYKLAIGSYLKVSIEMLSIGDSQQCVFRVQTSLSRAVCLNEQRNLLFIADVWTTEPVMQIEQPQKISAKITDIVVQQVDAFIQAYPTANPPAGSLSDTNNTTSTSVPARKQSSQQPVKKTVAEYKYVASKNSQVFHTPNCRSVKLISPENLVGYSSREEAVNAGKNPCKACKP
jgi:hypothetical protein